MSRRTRSAGTPHPLIWSPRALRGVTAITELIAADRPLAAQRWLARVTKRVGQLADFPRSGRVVPERDDPALRELLEGDYRIVYVVRAGAVEIVTVFDGQRRFPADVKPATEH